ncbi:MAG TPA: hypothetical protein VL147_23205, partial [Devosia sp.]|nr:hypothetical protein [Devosia sp.]
MQASLGNLWAAPLERPFSIRQRLSHRLFHPDPAQHISELKMPTIPPLQSLGTRICICGPSNSGKSTLAAAIAQHLDIESIHLDLLYHYPNTDWVQRPREEFFAGHALAVASDSWVMAGNYMALLPQRIARATGIILLGTDRWTAFYRYLRRTLFEHGRVGSLSG